MATYAGKTYSNGSVPASLLAPLDGDNYGNAELRRDAAASWNRARAEVKAKTGITLTVRGWNRSLAEQERFFFQRYRRQARGGLDPRWYKGARYVRFTGAPAAIPGTSNHGLGLAVDVVDFGVAGTLGNARRAASIAILKRHGWTDEEGQSIAEPWHLVYNPAKDTHPTPIAPPEVPDMDATQAKQLSDIHAALPKLTELHSGIAPEIDRYNENGGEKITFRKAIKEIRLATTAQLLANVTKALEMALASTTGIDKAELTRAVTGAVNEAFDDIEITLTKES